MSGAHWTPEQRQRQAAAIGRWQPWKRSTGPKTAHGKARVARNSYRGGGRPKLRALAKLLKAGGPQTPAEAEAWAGVLQSIGMQDEARLMRHALDLE